MIHSGNVGIGSTDPAKKFQVDSPVNSGLWLHPTSLGAEIIYKAYQGGTKDLDFVFEDSLGATSTVMTLKGNGALSGSVGIGTDVPEAKLHVAGGDVLADRGASTFNLTRSLALEGARTTGGDAFSSIDFQNFRCRRDSAGRLRRRAHPSAQHQRDGQRRPALLDERLDRLGRAAAHHRGRQRRHRCGRSASAARRQRNGARAHGRDRVPRRQRAGDRDVGRSARSDGADRAGGSGWFGRGRRSDRADRSAGADRSGRSDRRVRCRRCGRRDRTHRSPGPGRPDRTDGFDRRADADP